MGAARSAGWASCGLAVLLATAACAPSADKATPSDTLVLRDFTLIDGTGRAPVAGQALIMAGGRIKWVGPVAQLKVPEGATVQPLDGKFIMPGLIDSHVHLGLVNGITQDLKYQTTENIEQQLKTYAAYGVTTVQTLGTEQDLIFPIQKLRDGRPQMARVYTVGRGVVYKGSYGGVPGLEQSVATPEEARAMVDAQAAKGADLIKLWVDDEFGQLPLRMPPPISTAIIDEAHKDGKKTVAHIFYYDNAAELAREGIDAFAHSVRDKPVDDALIAQMKAGGVWQMAATLSREASFTYKTLPFLDDPFFSRAVTPAVLTELASPERAAKLGAAPNFPKYGPTLQMALANFGREAKAGIRYGMGTDSGPSARFPGYFAHWELELMVQAGVTPLQALTAATSANAEFMGAKDVGTIAPGKWADLLVLDRDPTADIRNTRAIDAVYVGGNKVPTIWQTCTGRPANACGPRP
ncbi:amidohydrolase family protein [Sphingomonas quercus]|uniref:Amidohydrolase family protein n=1 Tax=Sphingomonas quercus TaxID=2842451 RepID=A0ABS6BGY0_9SPHN|nr:amidohydrolase family protein [Sphingomonas quercus]MBU3077558.1 amidohydrolase family protein [Sphingomonas quercus]